MRIDNPIGINAALTGSFSGSFFGNGSGLTNVAASNVEYANVLNKPTLLSGSTTGATRFYTSTSPISSYSTLAAAYAAGVEKYHINSPTQGLMDNQLKPALNMWSLIKLIFKTYGYTIKSDFFNTPWFRMMYMYGYFNSDTTKFSYQSPSPSTFGLDGVDLNFYVYINDYLSNNNLIIESQQCGKFFQIETLIFWVYFC